MSPETSNAQIDNILDQMRQQAPASQGAAAPKATAAAPKAEQASANKAPAAKEAVFSNIDSLLLDADTAPAAESTTVSVSSEPPAPAPVPVKTAPEPPAAKLSAASKPAAAPAPAAKPSTAPKPAAPAAAGLPAKSIYVLAGLLGLNAASVCAIAVMAFMNIQGQKDNARMLGQLLREGVAARQAEPDSTPGAAASAKQGPSVADQAEQLYQAGQYSKAMPLLQKAVSQQPDRPELLWKLASSALNLKQWRTALGAFEKFSKKFPQEKLRPQAVMQAGVCYDQLGFYSSARKAYYRFVALAGRLDPQDQPMVHDAYARIAECYAREAAAVDSNKAAN